jgi:hypothetical protein
MKPDLVVIVSYCVDTLTTRRAILRLISILSTHVDKSQAAFCLQHYIGVKQYLDQNRYNPAGS